MPGTAVAILVLAATGGADRTGSPLGLCRCLAGRPHWPTPRPSTGRSQASAARSRQHFPTHLSWATIAVASGTGTVMRIAMGLARESRSIVALINQESRGSLGDDAAEHRTCPVINCPCTPDFTPDNPGVPVLSTEDRLRVAHGSCSESFSSRYRTRVPLDRCRPAHASAVATVPAVPPPRLHERGLLQGHRR